MMDDGDDDEIQMQISLNTHKKKPKNKKSGKKGSPRKQISLGIAIDIEQDTEKVLKVADYQCKVQKVQFEELTHNRQQEQIKKQMPEENGNLIQIKEDYQFKSDIAEQQPTNSDPSFVQKQVNQKVDEVYQKLDKDQFVDQNIQIQRQEILILKEDAKQNNEEISLLAQDTNAIEQGNKQQEISQFMPQSLVQNNQNKELKLNQEFDDINNEKLIEQNTINQSKVQNIQVQQNIKIQVINVPQTQNKELQTFHQVLMLTPNTKKSLKSKKEARNKKNLQKNKIELNIKDEQQEQQLQEISQGIQVESNICILNQNSNQQHSSQSQKEDEVQSTIKGVQENTVMEIQSDYNQVLNKQIEQNQNNLSQIKEMSFIQMKQAGPMEGSGICVQKADINKEQGQQNKKINQQSSKPQKIQWEEQEVAFKPIQRKKINKEKIKKNKKNKESIIYEQQIQVQMNIIEEKIGNDQSTAVPSQLQMDQNIKNIEDKEDKEYVRDEQKSTNERQAEQINKQNNAIEEGKQKSDRNEIKQQKQRTQQKSMHEQSANNRQVMVSNLVSMMKTYNDKGITLMKERIQMMKEDISSRLIRKHYQQHKMRQKPTNLAHYGQIIQENIKLKQQAILESALFSQPNQ